MGVRMRWSTGASSRGWRPSHCASRRMRIVMRRANEEVRPVARSACADAVAQPQDRGDDAVLRIDAQSRSRLCARHPHRGADVQERETRGAARRGDRGGRSDPVRDELRLCGRPRRETIALIWPHHGAQQDLPSLSELIELFNTTSKSELPKLIASLLTRAAINERWALVKLATGALRI